MRVSNGWSVKDLTIVCLMLNLHLVYSKYMLFCLLFSKSVYFVFLPFSIYVHAAAKLLSRFSRVRLCATPETAAHQAPTSLGFSRQEHWSGLPLPSPMCESEK